MPYLSKRQWRLEGFKRSPNKTKKYMATFRNKQTGKTRVMHFGARGMQQYRDSTGLGLFSKYDHNDPKRRASYKARHRGYIRRGYWSPGELSMRYLWT